ncbi:hypothetical protein KNE206_28120 [Kitasatospora sp. NE20-6]|uniref:WXG100 family type VII secretion target n=1 Tax=Kitasatospora sp. NE20-6 TaxID=2859066 RepID=UPI0034DBBA16
MTAFDQHDLIPLKRMVEHSRPERLQEVGEHWANVQKELEQAVRDLRLAVQHATANWEGDAADGFTKRAGVLGTSMSNTAAHAQNTSSAMKFAGEALQQTKATMAQIKVPSTFDSGLKLVGDAFDRSDAQFKADVAGGMDRISAVNKNYSELSATEIAHQYAIGVMEHLGPQYTQAAGYLKSPMKDDHHEPATAYPPEPENPVPPSTVPRPPVAPKYPNGVPDDRSSGGSGSGDSQGSKHSDPSGPTMPTPAPQPGYPTTPNPDLPTGPVRPPSTGIDSLPPVGTLPAPGGTGVLPGPGGGIGGGAGGGGGIGGGGIGGGAGLPPGGLPVGGFPPGRGGAGGGAARPGATGGAGSKGGSAGRPGGATAAGAAGGAAGQSRAGVPGMGGMAGAGGSGGGKSGAGKGGGGLVRRGGGAVGGAKGGAGDRAFTEGGSGIGKGRAGQNGAAGAGGPHGGPSAAGRKKDKEKNGSRPDYLVEDEETWRGGSANPPVIE